jgi:hypothetical protein
MCHTLIVRQVCFFVCLVVFNATFNNISVTRYIVAVSFIGGGNWRIRRKPPTSRKSLTNIITYYYIDSSNKVILYDQYDRK